MIRELDCVSLESDLPSHGLKRGSVGTVVFVYGQERAFEVEFFSPEGETIALATLNPDQVSHWDLGAVVAANGIGSLCDRKSTPPEAILPGCPGQPEP